MRTIPSPAFRRKTRRLPARVRAALAERLRLFMREPRHPLLNNHPLRGTQEGRRSINITGDWRLIYEPIDTDIAFLIDLDTHHNLYGT